MNKKSKLIDKVNIYRLKEDFNPLENINKNYNILSTEELQKNLAYNNNVPYDVVKTNMDKIYSDNLKNRYDFLENYDEEKVNKGCNNYTKNTNNLISENKNYIYERTNLWKQKANTKKKEDKIYEEEKKYKNFSYKPKTNKFSKDIIENYEQIKKFNNIN